MELANFTFIVTDDCNFNCSYCMQKKEKKTIAYDTIRSAVDFFYPYLAKETSISFYGGEPLLAFDRVRYAVEALEEKQKNNPNPKTIEYFLTTNGSLVTPEIIEFLARCRFGLLLSFDGAAQAEGRKKGTTGHMLKIMKELQAHADIDVQVNSVFTPQTLPFLTDSLRLIIEHNGPEIVLNIDTMAEWDAHSLNKLDSELKRLCEFLLEHYKKTGTVPVTNFKSTATSVDGDTLKEKREPGIFQCTAGLDRLAITPEGKLWGCYLFHDYFKVRENNKEFADYYFGSLDHFITNHHKLRSQLTSNYSQLRQDLFQVQKEKIADRNDEENSEENDFCFMCEHMKGCIVCPVNAAYSTESIGVISCTSCQLKKIQRKAQGRFARALKALRANTVSG